MENVNYKGREISLEDFLKEIFEEIPATKIKLSIEELKKYSTENLVLTLKIYVILMH